MVLGACLSGHHDHKWPTKLSDGTLSSRWLIVHQILLWSMKYEIIFRPSNISYLFIRRLPWSQYLSRDLDLALRLVHNFGDWDFSQHDFQSPTTNSTTIAINEVFSPGSVVDYISFISQFQIQEERSHTRCLQKLVTAVSARQLHHLGQEKFAVSSNRPAGISCGLRISSPLVQAARFTWTNADSASSLCQVSNTDSLQRSEPPQSSRDGAKG